MNGKTTKCDYRFDGGGWSRVLDSDWEGHGVIIIKYLIIKGVWHYSN